MARHGPEAAAAGGGGCGGLSSSSSGGGGSAGAGADKKRAAAVEEAAARAAKAEMETETAEAEWALSGGAPRERIPPPRPDEPRPEEAAFRACTWALKLAATPNNPITMATAWSQ